MPRIKDLQNYTGALNRADIFFAVDGNSFSRGMSMSGQQVHTLCKGIDGKNIELRSNNTHIQWRWEGDSTWANLIAVSSLKGEDGKELEIRVQAGYIQTRLTGGTWSNLIDLESLKGPKGNDAVNPDFTFQVNALAPDATPTSDISGTYPNLTVTLGLPKGHDAALPHFTFQVNALAADATPTSSITGTYPNLLVTLGIPKGHDAALPAFTFETEKGNPGTNPDVSVTGSYPDLNLKFKIPEGLRGDQGKPLVVLANGNYGNWDELSADYVDSGVAASATVDIENATVNFTESATRENLNTGEKVPVLFGKIKKWFSDFGALAWKTKVDYQSDIDNLPTIPTQTSELTNNSGFTTASSVTSKINAHNSDETAHSDIRTRISEIESNHYNQLQSDERYVQKETDKGLYPETDATKLGGIEEGAQKNVPSVDKSATITESDWIKQDDDTYTAIIYNVDILEDSKIFVMPADPDSIDLYAEAFIFSGTSSAGQLLLRAKNTPSGEMSINYTIFI